MSVYTRPYRTNGSDCVVLFSVDYLVIRPIQGMQCDMSSSYTKYWRKRCTLDVGHRGAGSSHAAK